MADNRFMKLVEDQHGFEFCQAFSDDVDHIIGGKGNTFWYLICKNGTPVESHIGTFQDGAWSDCYTKGKGAKAKKKEVTAGSTLERIEKQAYLMQEENWVKDRKAKLIEDSHPHFHYVYGFGDRALDVSEQYGVTIAFSDIQDPSSGFHLRYLYTGADVEPPKE